jgi:hypothetical protein
MDVPSLSFWETTAQTALFSDANPALCLALAHEYVDRAVINSPDWQTTLNVAPFSYSKLHYIAIMITMGPPQAAFNISLHILQTLVTLNYAPSILTMVRMALRRNMLGQPQFQQAESKFRAISGRKDDPNACTLQGMILAAQLTPETDRQAMNWFREAASIGGEEPGAWEWQASCALEMGKAYTRLQQPEKARAIWEYCAKQLDLEEGGWLYASSLERSHPERRDLVQKAAIGGNQEAAREMAAYEGSVANKTGASTVGAWDRKAAAVLQKEWEAIAAEH